MIDQIIDVLREREKSLEKVTENGAVGFATTGKHLLDMNFKVASYRSKTDDEIVHDFNLAWAENYEYALKWLFFARDIREGLGERRLFRIAFKNIINKVKISDQIKKVIALIPEYGRYDDLISLFDLRINKLDEYLIDLLKTQIQSDRENMLANKPISLCAKWMPSEGASSQGRRSLARTIALKWSMSNKKYRQIISSLRSYLDITEIKASSNQWDKIDYEKVPSRANIKYNAAFWKHDDERRQRFIEAVEKGEKKIHSGVNFPHDVVDAYTEKYMSFNYNLKAIDPALEQLWKALPKYDLDNTLVVADGSGSMMSPIGNTNTSALSVAIAIAIYCSENNLGQFKNKYITFSESPQYVIFNEKDSLRAKIELALTHSEVASTNIEAVFNLILDTAVGNQLHTNEMVKNILIISDMEFNDAADPKTYSQKLFNIIENKYALNGYKLPRLIFWNVNSRTNTVPVQSNELGVVLASGFSPAILKMIYSNNLDPYDVLIETLQSERYKPITLLI
jgi:hypothetical protein